MIEIGEKRFASVSCNCCDEVKGVKQLTFSTKANNSATAIAICETCRVELYNTVKIDLLRGEDEKSR